MKKTRKPNQVSTVSTMTMLLRHDKTEAEEIFTVQFLLYLKRIGYSGEIHCRCFLVNQFGQVRRPDFYLPRYGLAIDVDGLTRHAWEHRQNGISKRDQFYEDLGAQPLLVLDANWVVSGFKMDRFKREFSDLLFNKKIQPKQRILINKRLSEGRMALEESRPEIFNSHGGLASQFSSDLIQAGFREFRHFGGTRFVLRAKYKSKEERETEIVGLMLRRYCKNGDKNLPAKVYGFIVGLFERQISEYVRIDEIDIFGQENGLDDTQFYHLVNDFLKETWAVSLTGNVSQ